MPRNRDRRRRGYPRPGSGNVSVVEHQPHHAVSRQPLIVHGVTDIRRGESTVIGGRVVHDPVDLIVRQSPGPAQPVHPGPASPLVDFDILNRGIEARLEDARKFMGGFPQVPEVKRTSKLWPLVRHPRESKLVGGGYEGWLVLHPLKLLGQIFWKQKGKIVVEGDRRVLKQPGFFAARKENRRMAAAAALRNESGAERRMQD
ncbi:MAG: hypothetical protein Q8N60_05930, partial [Candidatus Diapherotrites archaeon]|nr:hypothetical protein [Candidatus Diapherotrites archaeon]